MRVDGYAFRFLLRKVHYEGMSEQQFNEFIGQLAKLSMDHTRPFQDIYFKNAPLLSMDHFGRFQLDRIITLSAINIPLLSDLDVIALSNRCQNLQYLNLSGCQSIYSISQAKGMINQLMVNPIQSTGLIFPKLKVLVANNMSQLKEVELVAPELSHLSTKNCQVLQSIYFASPRLQKLNVEQSLAIKFELKLLWSILGIDLSPKLNLLKCFGVLYKDKMESLNPLILFLHKAGLLQEDLYQYIKLNKKILDQGRKIIQDAILMAFIKNPKYKCFDLREINQEWKNQKTIYLDFLTNFHQLLQQSIAK